MSWLKEILCKEGKWSGGNLVDFGMEFSNCFDNDFELIMIFD